MLLRFLSHSGLVGLLGIAGSNADAQDMNRHPPDDPLFEPSLSTGTGFVKLEPCREWPDVPEADKIGAARAGNTDLTTPRHTSPVIFSGTHAAACSRWREWCLRPEFRDQ